jgi:hypothetical protein
MIESISPATNPTAKYRIAVGAMLSFQSTKNYHNKSRIFPEDLLPYTISGPYIKWR